MGWGLGNAPSLFYLIENYDFTFTSKISVIIQRISRSII